MPPRTPTAILDARGSFINKPSLRRPNEPTVTNDIGTAPTSMSKEEKKVWKELVKQAPPGVLKESDRLLFAVLVRLATRFYARQPMLVAECNQMIALGSRFAMTPADRSRVQVEKAPESKLSQFLQKKPATVDITVH